MPKKRKKRNGSMKEQMEGLAIAITPITIEKKRAKKQEGGEIEAQGDESVDEEDSLTLDTVLFKDDKERRVSIRDALEKSRPDSVYAYMQSGNKDWLFSKSYDDEGGAEYQSGKMPKNVGKYRLEILKSLFDSKDVLSEALPIGTRTKKAEGGDVDNQMNALMPVEETSADEEDRDIEAQMEELEAAKFSLPAEEDIMPDEQMEDEYLDFVVSQSLSPEEEVALMNKLEADPELSVMFDKIMDTAIEFSGAGPVEGPGSEVSDSIPARLSDGEFVFTSKAADQIGEERLQSMMEDAEIESDDVERQEIALGGKIEDKNIATEEIKKSMLSINPRMR